MKLWNQNNRPCFAACLIAVNVVACAAAQPDTVPSLVRAYEQADQPGSIADNLSRHPVDEVVTGILARLNDDQGPELGERGQNRLWEMLAKLGRMDAIDNADRVEQLALAYEQGTVPTRLAVAYALPRIDPVAFPNIFEVVRQHLPTETYDGIARVTMESLSQIGELNGQALEYAENILHDVHNTPAEMYQRVIAQNGPLVGQENGRGRLLRATALGAVLLSQPDASAATAYAAALPDNEVIVPPAMGFAAVQILEDADDAQLSAWIHEYTRRYCLDTAREHRMEYGLGFYLVVWEKIGDRAEDALCESFQTIVSTFTPENFIGYETAQRFLQNICD